jgi:diguanylate cyclase (GGDEF)-like protein
VLAVAFGVAEVLLIHFEFRDQAQALTLGEVPLIVGVVFCSPLALLAARLVGSAAALVGFFHQRSTKLAFNLSMHAAKVALAVTAYQHVLGDESPISPRGWLAAIAAAAAADAFSHLCIIGAITLTQTRPPLRALSPMAVACATVAVTNTSLALLTTLVLWYDAKAIWLLVVVALVFAFGYRSHSSTKRRYANLELLYRFTDSLSAIRGERDVMATMLNEARAVLRGEYASLALVAGGDIQRATIDDDGAVRTEVVPLAGTLEALVLDGGRPVLAARTTTDPGLRAALAAAGLRDALAAPVRGRDDTAGVLMVGGRLGEVTTFDDQDLRLFEALANHAGVALRSGQLLERLREEVAAKEHQALHDHLTGLPNRSLFTQRVDEALRSCGDGERVAVMLMDLDQFKEVNDTLGHHTGDTLLKLTARRLTHALAERGSIARLGGDEFAFVVPHVVDEAEATALAAEMRTATETAMSIDDVAIQAQASIGVAFAPEHGTDAATLLQRADVAMYAAKDARAGVTVYDAVHDHYSQRRLALVAELRHAIESNALELHYQPQVEMRTGEVTGVEALLRWNHPRHGFVPPDEFIPLAEHSGLIRPLTTWVLDTALRQLRTWRDVGVELMMAVNVSPRSLTDPGFAAEIRFLLDRYGVAPTQLMLELTETSVMTDAADRLGLLEQLAATGVQLSIDDFGTGYSSLARLARLPVNEVKIDRSFVMAMGSDRSAATIVRSTVELSRSLGLRSVAEGVEDLTAWQMLADLHCDGAQGYLISRPVPPAALPDVIAQWTRNRELLEEPEPVALHVAASG